MRNIMERNISEQILKFIHNNGMLKGDALPSERNLAEMMKSSRNSVREALKKLEALEILEIRRGSGCYIKNPDVKQLVYPEYDSYTLAVQNLDARTVVEPGIIRFASERLKARDMNQLKNIIVRMSRAVLSRDFNTIAIEDVRFLEIIGSGAGNMIITSLIKELESTGIHLWTALSNIQDENLNSIFGTYVKVLNSIQEKDTASSVRETEARLSMMKKYLSQSKRKQSYVKKQ